ncbi:MAG: hypothetical protein KKA19_03845 [Candidatus Margulisbacteria bacterium]|nr:hypothetical protein [Candidatus Margulisiibacteriota bacterium]
MTLEGWIFLAVSWLVIIGMAIFCFGQVLLPHQHKKKIRAHIKNKVIKNRKK